MAVSQGWLKENPLRKVKFPRSDPHRTRIPTEEEYQRLCAAAHWKDTEPPVNSYQRTVAAFRFSMLTGMRKGEIVKIERSWIDGSVIHLPAEAAKTAVGRTVAMGVEARRLLGLILSLGFSPCVWGINTLTLPGEFIKLKRRAGIRAITDSAGRELQADLHFHDARAYFCTWAASPAEDGAPRLSPMELARQHGAFVDRDDNALLTAPIFVPSLTGLNKSHKLLRPFLFEIMLDLRSPPRGGSFRQVHGLWESRVFSHFVEKRRVFPQP